MIVGSSLLINSALSLKDFYQTLGSGFGYNFYRRSINEEEKLAAGVSLNYF
jgi:hypothetical protein